MMALKTDDDARLRGALQQYALEHTAEPLFVLDKTGRLIGVNRSARNCSAVAFANLLDGPLAAFWSSLVSQSRAEAEVTAPGSTTARWEVSGVAVSEGFVVSVREYRPQASFSRGQQRRLECLGMLTAGIVHDLNNLLTPILILTERLALSASGETREALFELRSTVDKAMDLTRQTLAVARPRETGASLVSVGDVVQEMQTLIQRVVGDSVGVVVQVASTPQAMLDRQRLEHALLNLAANARDAMPDGGTLTLQVARVTTMSSTAYVGLKIIDTGIGMSSGVRARIFEPFFTTKNERGNGLGLAAVRAFVADSGGLISVSSRPRQGTAVAMFFPAATGRHISGDLP